MSLCLVRSEPVDLARLFSAGLRLTVARRHYGRLMGQMVLSETYSCFAAADDAAPVAIGGLIRLPDGRREAWFCCDRVRLAPVLLAFVRLVRATLQVLGRDGGVVSVIRTSNRRGQQLARLAGFVPAGDLPDGLQLWRFV